jgi:hypothetical protein
MKAPRFQHSMVDYLREHILAGLAGNGEIARVLADGYAKPIASEHVAAWRRQYARFDMVCTNALEQMHAECAGLLRQSVKDGDVATAKWWLERTNQRFKPASKLEHAGRVEGLGEMLSRRVSEDELRAQGVLIDDDN